MGTEGSHEDSWNHQIILSYRLKTSFTSVLTIKYLDEKLFFYVIKQAFLIWWFELDS